MPEWTWIIRGAVAALIIAAVIRVLFLIFAKRTETNDDTEWEILSDDEHSK